MRLITLGPASGKHAWIAADARGWVVVYQDEATGALVFQQLHPEGSRRTQDVPIGAGGPQSSFPRVYVDSRGETWLAWRENPTSTGRLLNVTTSVSRSLGTLYGNDPACFGNDEVAFQDTPTFDVVASRLSGLPHLRVLLGAGRGTGLSHIDAGGAVLTRDAVRTSVPGMANPQSAGGCTVGENADDGPNRNIARLADGREAVLWAGLDSFTPSIAAGHGRWAVVTWGAPQGVRLAVLEDADFAVPHDPEADFAFVPDGTLVTDAFDWLIGRQPSRQGDIICLHKNIGQAEWRRVDGDRLYFYADASRVPGDPGWFIEPQPVWAVDTFRSGDAWTMPAATIYDLRPGVAPNRWRQRNTLRGCVGGGGCVEFDPRFPLLDYGPEKLYERHYNLNDGRIRWECWYTPLSAKGRLAWGDRSEDVLLRRVDGRTDPNAQPQPFIQPPARVIAPPPPPPPEPPRLKPREQFYAEFRQVNDFYAAEEGLQRPGGMVIGGACDTEAMAAWGYDLMGGATVEQIKSRIRQSEEWRTKHATDPQPPPQPFAGPIGVAGRDFVTP
jgi:hypothetical protein